MRRLLSIILSFMVMMAFCTLPSSAYATNAGMDHGVKTVNIQTHSLIKIKKPGKVKGLKVVNKSDSSVTLKWKKAKRAKGYQVYYSTQKTKGYKFAVTVKKGSNVKATVKNLKSNKKYYFKVRALKKNLKGKFSKPVAAKTEKMGAAAQPTSSVTPQILENYSITYELNGGTASNPTSYTKNDEVSISNPTRNGYTFVGWTGTGLTDPTKDLVISKGSTGAREYTAHWTANLYTVLFNANTGQGNMNPVTFTYDVSDYLPSNEFTKTDSKFICWNTKPDGSGVSYNNEALVKNLSPEGNVTLFAQWASSSSYAMLKDGRFVNGIMKQLAGNSNANYSDVNNTIMSIERSDNPAPAQATVVSVKSIYSPSTLDMWFDSSAHAVYYYSPAEYIFLNPDSRNLFSYFSALTNIDFNGFRTDDVTNMSGMFAQTTSLTSLNLSSFNTAKVNDMSSMFSGCRGCNEINVSTFDTRKVTNMNRMFSQCESISSLDLSSFNTSEVTDMEKMFDYLPLVENIDVSSFDTGKVTKMTGMFRDCSKLKSLDLSSFDTGKVKDMSEMFGCTDRCEKSGLTSIKINSATFKTSEVTTMNQMFYKCADLKSFDFSGFNTEKVNNMQSMFSYCSSLTSLDLSSFSTGGVTNMYSMFRSCSLLTTLDVSGFDTSGVINMNRMFSSCSSLTTLDISNFDTHNVTDMTKMFDNMRALTKIYASDKFTTNSVTNGSDVFKNDVNLVGGMDTACDGSNNVNYYYAHIDGGESWPGYFTRKQ